MARKKTITWQSETVTDDGARYRDLKSSDGHWWIAQGFDERDRKLGRPWLLMYSVKGDRPPWNRVDTFASVAEAKSFAEEMV